MNFTKLIFGAEFASKELAEAINAINEYLPKEIITYLTQSEKDQYALAKKNLRSIIDSITNSSETSLFQGFDLTPEQKKALIFILLFAGQETTAALLTHMIWRLASDQELQQKLYEDHSQHTMDRDPSLCAPTIIETFYAESLKIFPPAFNVPRTLDEDVCLEYHVKGEVANRTRVYYKGENIAVDIEKLAKSILNAPENKPSNWFAFGAGPHSCPGEKLAEAEICHLLLELIKKFKLTTTQASVKYVGGITLRFSEPVYIKVHPR